MSKGLPRVIVILLQVAKLLLIGATVFTVVLYFSQRKMIFPSAREMDRDPGAFDWDYEEVRLPVSGKETFGWYIPLENARGVVLFSHGNAGNLAGRLESIGLLRSFGFSVLAYDYGGYGYSTGKASEKRCYADIRAMWDYLVDVKQIPQEKIVLFGRSLGAGPTAELAQFVQPAAVILESPFLSVPDVTRAMPVVGRLRFLIRHRFNNKDKVAKIKSPLLVVHSPDDEVIPYAHGQKVYELANEPKTFLEIEGGHNNGFVMSENYRPGWEAFLTPILGPKVDSNGQR